ncbi:SUKH-4 family immunity protein [Streptomyces sp. NBC_01016]|uniref:SUKH-4 family immunity protein n=1 Tax=Streptomyces sp. NBC_01016 TaxID=2903720 RepID=UPI0022527EE6|nr:SUKH-4 family immunity protein [Streptomyces sp. NBC_01016]MCX4834899.1 SUKH-4 family immunity protein [Streptomyces sp. NBC_01016]
MPRPTADTSPQGSVEAVVEWWHEGQHTGSVTYVVSPVAADGASVVRRAHERIPGSVLVDATGLTTEQVLHQALTAFGVDLSADKQRSWQNAELDWTDHRLLLVVNAHRAGPTRRSHEPEHLLGFALRWLAHGKLTVLTDTSPALLPRGTSPKAVFDVSPSHSATPLPESSALRALALAEPRVVPVAVWAELVAALSGVTPTEGELTTFVQEHSALVRSGPLGVSFVDEGVAEALRAATAPDELRRVNSHLSHWLLQSMPTYRHPDGWARSGALGLYAATGLAMHAVQAGTYEELGRNGEAIANIPKSVLMDAGRTAVGFLIPGNTPAADAKQLWTWGVVPDNQRSWASWLHLMTLSRNDHEAAAAIAASSMSLPWQAKWAKWRPPGGYHPVYLQSGKIDALVEVRWRKRPAVAGRHRSFMVGSRAEYTSIWDAETGERLAGPWEGDEGEHRADLSWPPQPAPEAQTQPHPAEGDSTGPSTVRELFAAAPPRRNDRSFLWPCVPLTVGDITVLGSDSGLVAIEAADGIDLTSLGSLNRPLSGSYASADGNTPVDSPGPDQTDHTVLPLLFDDIFPVEPEELPDGLTHEPTRELLLDFGLPDVAEGGMRVLPYCDWDVEILEEMPSWPDDIDPIDETGPFFQIGRWMGGEIVIDGPTGHVLRVPTGPDEEELAALPAAHSLEAFLTMVAWWVTGLRIRDTLPPPREEKPDVLGYVLGALTMIDDKGSEAPAWAYVFENE